MKQIKINFGELIKKYEENLVTQLRGFGDYDFLKYWVPSPDILTSLENLIDALIESNNLEFDIIFDNEFSSIEKKLKEFDETIGSIALIEDKGIQKIFKFKIDLSKYNNFYKEKFINIKKNKLSNLKLFPTVKKLQQEIIDYEIDNDYVNEIKNMKVFKLKNFNNNVNFNNFYESSIYDGKIFVEIHNNIITKACHNFSEINHLNIIIDLFVDHIKLKPIQEAAEHSAIYIEYLFRPKNFNKKIKGIILPDLCGKIFQRLNNCIREIMNDYQNKSGYKKNVNKFYVDISNNWKKKSYENKIEIIKNNIKKCISQFLLEPGDIIFHKLEMDFRIILNLSVDFKKKLENRNYLIEIEEIMKKNIDNRIELFIIEIEDLNKLRLKNSPQKIT